MDEIPKASGPVFSEDHFLNLYYVNELYGNIAARVSKDISEALNAEIPLTSGVWGGTYLIADERGKSRRRIWRLYSIVNLPQNSPLDKRPNLERLIALYSQTYIDAFNLHGLKLDLKMWGGELPFSNKKKPTFTMHMVDANKQVNWLRTFFVWNAAAWIDSIIHDQVRMVNEYKQYFNLETGPVAKPPQEIKYMLQDIIIIYRTLQAACDKDFREHAEPIIEELTQHFLLGLHDPKMIFELYEKTVESALVYGYEQTLDSYYGPAGLTVKDSENWPLEKINWAPEELKQKLSPPIESLFAGFKVKLQAP